MCVQVAVRPEYQLNTGLQPAQTASEFELQATLYAEGSRSWQVWSSHTSSYINSLHIRTALPQASAF